MSSIHWYKLGYVNSLVLKCILFYFDYDENCSCLKRWRKWVNATFAFRYCLTRFTTQLQKTRFRYIFSICKFREIIKIIMNTLHFTRSSTVCVYIHVLHKSTERRIVYAYKIRRLSGGKKTIFLSNNGISFKYYEHSSPLHFVYMNVQCWECWKFIKSFNQF